MKNLLCLVLLISIFSCKKEKFESCPEYEKLIGEWKSLDSEEEIFINFNENGVIERKSKIQRNMRTKFNSVKKTSSGFIFSATKFSFGIFSNNSIDTIGNYYALTNPKDSSLNQYISFIKIK